MEILMTKAEKNLEELGFDKAYTTLYEKNRERLVEQYTAEIDAWGWEGIYNEAMNNADERNVGSCYLGTVFSLTPSGKYYTSWASSNIEVLEAVKDDIWQEVLEGFAVTWGGYITSGEGDPCDIFFETYVEKEKYDERPFNVLVWSLVTVACVLGIIIITILMR